jgi:hypothetical protein
VARPPESAEHAAENREEHLAITVVEEHPPPVVAARRDMVEAGGDYTWDTPRHPTNVRSAERMKA